MADETEKSEYIAFKCSPEMKEFIERESGEESISTYIRQLIKREMEAESVSSNLG